MVMPLIIQFASIPAEYVGRCMGILLCQVVDKLHIYTGGPEVTRVTSSQNWSGKNSSIPL